MTACVMARECKEPSAPGEVPEEVFSDGGSTPPASTIKITTPKGVVIFMDTGKIQLLGANELPLRQGFCLWQKRLYGAKAPPRCAGPIFFCIYTVAMFQMDIARTPIFSKAALP